MLQQFVCNGKVISRLDDSGFFNLTELVEASNTGKRLDKWLRLKETKDYVTCLATTIDWPLVNLDLMSESSLCTPNKIPHILHPSQDKESSLLSGDLSLVASQYSSIQNLTSIMFTLRGVHGGTWGHPTLAINLMRWLSVEFAVWCDKHIIRLMQTGKTELSVNDVPILSTEQFKLFADKAKELQYAVDFTQVLLRERQIVLDYRAKGIPDIDMYFVSTIIQPHEFDTYHPCVIRERQHNLNMIARLEGQPELQQRYIDALQKHQDRVQQRIQLLFDPRLDSYDESSLQSVINTPLLDDTTHTHNDYDLA